MNEVNDDKVLNWDSSDHLLANIVLINNSAEFYSIVSVQEVISSPDDGNKYYYLGTSYFPFIIHSSGFWKSNT